MSDCGHNSCLLCVSRALAQVQAQLHHERARNTQLERALEKLELELEEMRRRRSDEITKA